MVNKEKNQQKMCKRYKTNQLLTRKEKKRYMGYLRGKVKTGKYMCNIKRKSRNKHVMSIKYQK